MIQNLSLIPSWTNRLLKSSVLVLLLSVCSTAVWANSSTDYYGKITAKSDPSSGAGKIYIAQSESTPTESDYKSERSIEFTNTAWFGYQEPTIFYCYATETELENYIWAGWYDGTTLIGNGDFQTSYEATPNSENKYKRTQFNLTAKWVQPKVTNGATVDFGTITDMEVDVEPEQVSLGVTDYSKVEHFKVQPNTAGGFTANLLSVTQPVNWAGTATVEVDYTPSGVHDTHTGTVYLASALYNRDYTSHNYTNDWQAITFKVNEDYTPNYTVVHNKIADAYNMGTTNVGGTLTSADQALKVVDGTKNYAASAPTYSGVGNKQHTTEWSAEIVPCTGKEDYSQYFTIQAGTENTEFPVVVFNAGFTVSENTTKTVYACIELTCTYHDRSAPIVQNITNTETKYIYLSANVEQTNEAKLDIVTNGDADTYDFGTVYIGETPTVTLPLTAMNVTNITSKWTTNNTIFEGSVSGNHITLSVKDDISCGTYSSTFEVSATSTLDNTTTKSDEITVTADVQLAAPEVTATGADKAVVFQWNPVPGATKYIIYSNADGTTKEAETTDCVHTQTVSANGTSVTRWIKAVNDDCESTLTEAKAEANLNTITKENAANTGIWTGTESRTESHQGDYEENFPWRTKRPVNVSAAFDEAGNALFDRLYIFALTTGESENVLSTPCLIYNKATDGKSYTYSNNEININSASKNEAFTITPTANQKLYFTGYCPYAAAGGATDNGVIEIKGDAKTVDIYLDSLQLYARKETETIEITSVDDIQGGTYISQGSGGVFVLTSTSIDTNHPFVVNIHTRGKNTLASQNGSKVNIKIEKEKEELLKYYDTKHYSAPIEVLPTSASSAVRLTIDDVWPNAEKNTNGVLVLKEKAADKSNISIGLGNALTQLNLAGGQLKLQSIAATYQTTTYTATKEGVTLSVLAYGLWGEAYEETLNANNQIGLKDGTYNALSETEVAFYTKDLNIDGGTYNTGIKHYTSASSELTTFYNSDGKELSGFEVSNANLYGTTTDGKYTVTKFAEMVDSFFPDAGVDYQQSGGTTYHSPLSAYYVGGKTYGHSSYAPAGEKLKLWLPKLNCEGAHIAWQICAPDLDAQVSGNTIPLGGSINKVDGCPVHTENKYTVDYLLYMQMDKYTKDALPDYSLRQSSATEVKLALEGDELYSTIDNTNSYTIQKKVYMLVPIEAAKWTLFAPPFDVANVYVIEAYPEAQLIKDFKGKRGRIPTEYIAAARKAQAQRLLDLYTFWYYEEKALGDAQAYDFFGTGDGYTNGYGKFVNSWINYQNTQNYKVDASGDYNPVIDKLIHFTGKNGTYPDGKNWLYANYYLYEQKGDWTFDNTTNNFTTAWDTVTTPLYGTNSSIDPIMKKGKVYAMEFPFNSLNGVHNPDQTWDYWTGKYLLIESTAGVQTINGSSAITFSDANIASGSASLMGNNTFANVTATPISNSGTNAAFWSLEKIDAGTAENTGERDKHVFQRVDDNATIAPTTGFLLANFKAPANMRARTINYQNGVVTYDTIPGQSEDTPTSIPTIMGQQTLYVQTTQTGLTITPIVPQQVVVYNAAGQMVMNKYITAPEQLALPAGVYVVRGEYENVKAMHNSI